MEVSCSFDHPCRGGIIFSSPHWSQPCAATLYLAEPSEMIGSTRVSGSRAAMRQSCWVSNSSVVTVPDAALLIANVKITSAHMNCPFLVSPVSHSTKDLIATYARCCPNPVFSLGNRSQQVRNKGRQKSAPAGLSTIDHNLCREPVGDFSHLIDADNWIPLFAGTPVGRASCFDAIHFREETNAKSQKHGQYCRSSAPPYVGPVSDSVLRYYLCFPNTPSGEDCAVRRSGQKAHFGFYQPNS